MSYTLSSSRVSGGGGLGLGGAGLARAGVGIGLARAGLSLGGGSAGLGIGTGAGLGLGLGGGAGAGLGFGLGGAGLGVGLGGGSAGLGLGGAGGGGMFISPAFAMGRTFAAGGMSGSSALALGPSLGPALGPVLTREAEKHMLAGLNDRFSVYIAKMQDLQHENRALEAQLSQLTGGTSMTPDLSTSTVEVEAQLSEYRNTLEVLTLDTIKLEVELDNVRGTAHELKAKFDFEQGVRFQLEADIASMKKDIEMASDLRIELDAKLSSLKNELDFVTKTQEEELASLQSKLGTTTVDTSMSMIEVDTERSFDISHALNKMREEYEKSVHQHKEEADAYFRLKMDEITTATVKSSEAISTTKLEIVSAKKDLQGLGLELQALLTLNMTLEQSLADAQAQSTVGVAEYQTLIASLTSAIEVAKNELHKRIMAYQELLDIKMALDVEISTYRKLLEGSDLKLPESFSAGSYTFTGGDAPLCSTPQNSSHNLSWDARYTLAAGTSGISLLTEDREST